MRLFIVAVYLMILPSCKDVAPASAPPYRDIGVEEFADLMRDSNAVVLDVRTPPEIAAGKIAGALELDYNAPGFRQKLNELDPTKTYLVYCRSGRRSGEACEIMKAVGFGTLYNLDGGYLDWAPKQKE